MLRKNIYTRRILVFRVVGVVARNAHVCQYTLRLLAPSRLAEIPNCSGLFVPIMKSCLRLAYYLSIFLLGTLCLSACAGKEAVAANTDTSYQQATNVSQANVNQGSNKRANASAADLSPVLLQQLAAIGGDAAVKGRSADAALNTVAKAKTRATYGPKASGFTDAAMNFNYMPGALFEIYCAPLSVTDVQFQKGERIIAVAAGDTMRWQVSKTYSGNQDTRREHILVKPTDVDLTNTMVVTTDQRTYHLLLHSTAKTYMPLVSWRYSDDDMMENFSDDKSAVATPDQMTNFAEGLDLNHLDFNYQVKQVTGAKPEWMPNLVFNDGNKTYIRLPTKIQQAPTLFIGSSISNSQIINYRVVGDYYVVDSLFPQAQLRTGERQNQIVVQINYTKK